MKDYTEKISELTYFFVLPGLQLLREKLHEIVGSVDSALVQSYINLMNFRIGPMAGREGKAPPDSTLQELIRKNTIIPVRKMKAVEETWSNLLISYSRNPIDLTVPHSCCPTINSQNLKPLTAHAHFHAG